MKGGQSSEALLQYNCLYSLLVPFGTDTAWNHVSIKKLGELLNAIQCENNIFSHWPKNKKSVELLSYVHLSTWQTFDIFMQYICLLIHAFQTPFPATVSIGMERLTAR